MKQIPVGKYFEQLVDFLKDTFQGFFDGVSAMLGVVITALKNTLLLSPEHLYASLGFGLLLTVALVCLVRRKFPRLALPALVLAPLLFGGLEAWRLNSLHRPLAPGHAATLRAQCLRVAEELERERRATPREVLAALEAGSGLLSSTAEDAGAEAARRAVSDALRHVGNSRGGDPDRAGASLRAAAGVLQADAISAQLPEGALAALLAHSSRFDALSAIEPLRRLARDLARVTAPVPMKGFVNERAHDRLAESLQAAWRHAGATKNTALQTDLARLLAELSRLDPNRLDWYAPALLIGVLVAVAWLLAGTGVAVFSVAGFLLVVQMGLWAPMVESLALVLSSTLFALLLGIPLGIVAARSAWMDRLLRPLLDLMQTMPAFVYLIPAVIFFGLGEVPGAMATLIFSMPPAVRLTALGIRQVPREIVEAAQAFGATGRQMLFKAQLPIALPTILAGVNQTIMLSLSMVVIAGMIGAGGLGSVVLGGITQMKIGLGFEGGLAVVILAVYLDRVTQALGRKR